jgi:hypothetical protein
VVQPSCKQNAGAKHDHEHHYNEEDNDVQTQYKGPRSSPILHQANGQYRHHPQQQHLYFTLHTSPFSLPTESFSPIKTSLKLHSIFEMPTFTVFKGQKDGIPKKSTTTKPDQLTGDKVIVKVTASGLCGTG